MIVFIVGTGTDVGKTHVTAALMGIASKQMRAVAWKPIATGMTDELGDDARAIGAIVPPMYAFEPPISPHLAARQVGVIIRAQDVATKARTLAESTDILFVESAGGLFSPISELETNFDIARALLETSANTKLLLVAPDRIGVLHDITATVRAASGVTLDVVALSAVEHRDPSSGTNAGEVRTLGLAKHVVEFPRATPRENEAAAALCLKALQAS